MALSTVWAAFSLGACISLCLQGCPNHIDDGPESSPTLSPTPSPTVSPGPTTPPSEAAQQAADHLNALFTSFDENNISSKLGTTISMAGQPGTFFGNIFCSSFKKPDGTKTGCWNGGADCRLSASIYNHKVILNAQTKRTLAGMGRTTGIVLNQEGVEKKWGKCSWLWDGATANRLNRGCGLGAGGKCDVPGNAFDNKCGQGNMKTTCTIEDDEVKRVACKPYGFTPDGQLGVNVPEQHYATEQCYFPGVAWDYHEQPNYVPNPDHDHLRDMLKARVKYNSKSDNEGPNIEKWNEVVIDELLWLDDMQKDPSSVITAFVYVKSALPASLAHVKAMQKEYFDHFHVVIPLVAIDDQTDRPQGPFVALPEHNLAALV